MANLPETEDFADGTYQIETSDRVLGGPGGIANRQGEQLGNRTAWLKAAISKIIDGTSAVGKATQLATARTLKFKGAVSGSGSYDGTGDTEIALTLADAGVAAGTYTKVTINVKGLVTGASNPTTLAGYGITDSFTKPETTSAIQQAISNLVASSPATLDTLNELAAALGNDPNFATTMANALASKASKATTLGGYGITDAFTKPETAGAIQQAVAALVASSPDALDTLKELATALGNDPNFATTMTNALAGKASKATTLDGYSISVATQIDAEATAGIDNSKPMTALRVAQSIAKRVVAAGEAVAGISRFATLQELLAGAGGYLALCPAYVLSGFAASFAANGYIKLPTWLSGFMIQWAVSDESNGATDYRFFPVPFPSAVYGAHLQLTSDTPGSFGLNIGTIFQVVDQSRYLWSAAGTWGGGGRGFMVAFGR